MPEPAKKPALIRLADWSFVQRRRVMALWLAILVGTLVAGSAFGGEYAIEFNTPGAESEKAQDTLESRFNARAGDTIQLVYRAESGITDPEVRLEVEAFERRASSIPHAVSLISPYQAVGAQVSFDNTIGFAVLQLDITSEQMPTRDTRELMKLAEESRSDILQVELSGFAVENAEQGEFGSEFVGFLAAAFILLLTFGSFVAMGLPILTALFGLAVASALITLFANVIQVPEFAPSVAAMIGIGVGIDYVLFILTRYRAGLADGLSPRNANINAMATSGRAVVFAGFTVIISLLGLFVMGLEFLRGLAISASSGVLIIMLASITLLPAVLGFIGTNIDRFRAPFVGRHPAGARGPLWYRWSRIIQRRPWPAFAGGLVVVVLFAAPLFGIRFGFPDASNNAKEKTTRIAYDWLTDGFGPGFNGPLLVVAEIPPGLIGVASPDPEGGNPLDELRIALSEVPGVAAVVPAVLNVDNSVALYRVLPDSAPQDEETVDLVHRLRKTALPELTEPTGIRARVTGPTAASVDISDYVNKRLPWFIGAVLFLSFLLLMVVFRSIVVPLKAAIMNVFSIGAAYGVIGLATNGGWFGNLLGIEEAVPIPSFVPMMMFAILFGLSMDYEVFLLSRVREEYLRTGDNATAVANGLANTARVITAAAAIMVAVFLSFVLGNDVFTKVIGIGLATAIFVDATIIRMVLVPATMELLGDANWWLPKWLDRLLPDVHVEGSTPVEARKPKPAADALVP